MARYKPTTGELQSLADVDKALKELCALEAEIERIDSEGEKQIAAIKAKTAEAGKDLRERVKEISATIKAFCDYHKGEYFKDKKSIDLAFGTIGYRLTPPSISISKQTLPLMKQLGMAGYIRIKEEVDKEALLTLDDDILAQIEAVKKQKNEFFIQPKREQVNKELLASA
ncbi:host-nuclease inhibitor Gam family protein [Gracilinema caldarium]|uniref:host-nuclease inhibitor Gam family protein n=1 Tax=Gracilinema caldarium TaxID=215591 RepID=UPI0026ED6156|nr:host-nuclease inhibitor Gam family protein [Gracilinema caldarium]